MAIRKAMQVHGAEKPLRAVKHWNIQMAACLITQANHTKYPQKASYSCCAVWSSLSQLIFQSISLWVLICRLVLVCLYLTNFLFFAAFTFCHLAFCLSPVVFVSSFLCWPDRYIQMEAEDSVALFKPLTGPKVRNNDDGKFPIKAGYLLRQQILKPE